MFERQVGLHRERLSYLESLKSKGSFDGIILPPTALDVSQELQREDEDNSPWTLSQVCLLIGISIILLTCPL
jgi:hypothetical protein